MKSMIKVASHENLDKKIFGGALRRRQLRLVLAKKMKPEDAKELKSIFIHE